MSGADLEHVDEALALERAAWDALSTTGVAAVAFLRANLAADVCLLLPGDLVIDDRERAIASMADEPWSSYELSDIRTMAVGGDACAVIYRAEARRGGFHYAARCASTYVLERGCWKLQLHQQTPF